jgi:hypothetical protein
VRLVKKISGVYRLICLSNFASDSAIAFLYSAISRLDFSSASFLCLSASLNKAQMLSLVAGVLTTLSILFNNLRQS